MAMTEPSRLALSCEAISDWSCALPGSVVTFSSLYLLRSHTVACHD